jgi:hypothetical protein
MRPVCAMLEYRRCPRTNIDNRTALPKTEQWSSTISLHRHDCIMGLSLKPPTMAASEIGGANGTTHPIRHDAPQRDARQRPSDPCFE